ncbi:CorA metal ion transporter [Rhodotorula toruloides]|uniref:Uncharacterized protein n=1 Tax=Rhodotorula toruloides TaxID=5286 RepID=A0A2T0A7K0_RHOTO|nr:hypothetical protein AAT19DRAFT_15463 [Rhodotorula toruloides]
MSSPTAGQSGRRESTGSQASSPRSTSEADLVDLHQAEQDRHLLTTLANTGRTRSNTVRDRRGSVSSPGVAGGPQGPAQDLVTPQRATSSGGGSSHVHAHGESSRRRPSVSVGLGSGDATDAMGHLADDLAREDREEEEREEQEAFYEREAKSSRGQDDMSRMHNTPASAPVTSTVRPRLSDESTQTVIAVRRTPAAVPPRPSPSHTPSKQADIVRPPPSSPGEEEQEYFLPKGKVGRLEERMWMDCLADTWDLWHGRAGVVDGPEEYEEFQPAVDKFIEKAESSYENRCLPPTPRFVAQGLMPAWRRLVDMDCPPFDLLVKRPVKESDSKIIRCMFARSWFGTDEGAGGVASPIAEDLRPLQGRILDEATLRQHTAKLEPIARLLDGRGRAESIALSSTSGSSSSSAAAEAKPEDDPFHSTHPRIKVFLQRDKIPPEDARIAKSITSLFVTGHGALHAEAAQLAHIIPNRPHGQPLFYAVRHELLLSAQVTAPYWYINHYSNIFYVESVFHTEYDKDSLAALQHSPYLDALLALVKEENKKRAEARSNGIDLPQRDILDLHLSDKLPQPLLYNLIILDPTHAQSHDWTITVIKKRRADSNARTSKTYTAGDDGRWWTEDDDGTISHLAPTPSTREDPKQDMNPLLQLINCVVKVVIHLLANDKPLPSFYRDDLLKAIDIFVHLFAEPLEMDFRRKNSSQWADTFVAAAKAAASPRKKQRLQ